MADLIAMTKHAEEVETELIEAIKKLSVREQEELKQVVDKIRQVKNER